MTWYGILIVVVIAGMVLFFCAIAIVDYVIRKHVDDERTCRYAQRKASQLHGFEKMTREEQEELIKLLYKIYKRKDIEE